jgi:hypothetical protein
MNESKWHNNAMHAELAAVPDSLYQVTRANRVIAVVMAPWMSWDRGWHAKARRNVVAYLPSQNRLPILRLWWHCRHAIPNSTAVAGSYDDRRCNVHCDGRSLLLGRILLRPKLGRRSSVRVGGPILLDFVYSRPIMSQMRRIITRVPIHETESTADIACS